MSISLSISYKQKIFSPIVNLPSEMLYSIFLIRCILSTPVQSVYLYLHFICVGSWEQGEGWLRLAQQPGGGRQTGQRLQGVQAEIDGYIER